MKKTFCLIAVLALFTFFPGLFIQAEALSQDEVLKKQAEALKIDKAEEAANSGESSGTISFSELLETGDYDNAFSSLMNTAAVKLPEVVSRAVKSILIIIVIAIFTSVTANINSESEAGKVPNFIPIAGAMGIAVVSIGDIGSMMGMGKSTIEGLEAFSKALMPALAAAGTAAGSPLSSAARHMATMLFSDIVITVINRVLSPLVYAYAIICVAKTAMDKDSLARIGKFVKWGVNSVLTILMSLFIGYLTVSGVMSGSADVAVAKGAKFALSGTVPVVGSILSDAAETVVASANVIKNTLGAFGMIAVLAICMTPFLYLGVNYILYKLTAAIASAFADSRICTLVDDLCSAFGLIMGMTGASAFLIFISITSAVKVAGNIV